MPEALWRGMHERFVLPHGARCLPRRRGNDTLTLSAASSGQGHVRAARGLPTHCRWEDSLHVPSLVPRQHGTGVKSTRKNRAGSCLYQTTVHLVRSGTRHRSMAQVRFLAGWLSRHVTSRGRLPSSRPRRASRTTAKGSWPRRRSERKVRPVPADKLGQRRGRVLTQGRKSDETRSSAGLTLGQVLHANCGDAICGYEN